MKLTSTQERILSQLEIGKPAIVCTSQYAEICNNMDNLPIIRGGTSPAIRGLVAKGLIKSSPGWRTAIVTRIA